MASRLYGSYLQSIYTSSPWPRIMDARQYFNDSPIDTLVARETLICHSLNQPEPKCARPAKFIFEVTQEAKDVCEITL